MDKKPHLDSSAYGKSMEYLLIGAMLQEGLEVYCPVVDDRGIDAIIRRPDRTFVEVQIKTTSKGVAMADAGFFVVRKCEPNPNYFFIFHAALIGENGKMWIMSANEFIAHASQNTQGKNIGTYNLKLNGCKVNEETGLKTPYALPQFEKFACTSFERLLEGQGNST